MRASDYAKLHCYTGTRMSVNGAREASSADSSDSSSRYSWPHADEAEVARTCARIARLIVRAGARTVGILPMGPRRPDDPSMDLAPLLDRLAGALVAFDGAVVGLVGLWRGWGQEEVGASQRSGTRPVRPGVVEILMPACTSARAAAEALKSTLAAPPAGLARVLADLGELGPAGQVPAAASAVDSVITVIPARRVRKN